MVLYQWCHLGSPRQNIKMQRHHFANRVLYSQIYGFSSIHVQMLELDHKEDWTPENWCFQLMVLEKTLESPLGCTEIKPVNPKGNQLWIFIGRTDAEAPVLWLPELTHLKRPCLMLGKTEGRRRRGRQNVMASTQWTWVWANSRR